MRIHFDEINLHAEMAGPAHGLTKREIESHLPQAQNALRDFRRAFEEDRYGFPGLPFQSAIIKEIREFAALAEGAYDTVCLVGIGGSALGAWALDCGLRGPHPVQRPFSPRHPRLVVLDNVDPALTGAALEVMNPKRTLVTVIAKSGATAETVATFLIVRDWMQERLGRKAARRIVAVTSPGRGELAQLAAREGYRTFPIPLNVGGRFSVLSAVGLLPAALLGIDIRKLAKGAAAMTRLSWEPDLRKNAALRAALLHYLIYALKGKSIHVAFPYSNRLWAAAFWFRQLWAESLGKARTRKGELVNLGQTPVAALGTTDQHSQVQLYMEGPNDKVFTFWALRKHALAGRIPKGKNYFESFDYLCGRSLAELLEAERVSTAAALTGNGRPNCTLQLDRLDEEHMGALLQFFEFQTAFMGELLDIDAFDQEGVELGKKFTFGLMGRPGFEAYRETFAAYERKRKETAL